MQPFASVAVTVNGKVPTTDGEPDNIPVETDILIPDGNDPEVILKLDIPIAPVLIIVSLYACPAIPCERKLLETETVMTGQVSVIAKAFDPVQPFTSVPVTVKLEIPTTVGVPETKPFPEFRLIPNGKLPAVTEYDDMPIPPTLLTLPA